MAKGKRKNAKKQHDMDADGGAEWTTGPVVEPAEEMDTREAGTGEAPLIKTAQQIPGIPGSKQKPGPRGKRTTAQKKRKESKLKRALAVADRIDAKTGRLSSASAARKATKALWASGKKKR